MTRLDHSEVSSEIKEADGVIKNGAFGKVQAWLYSIEFQKHGLLWLKPAWRIAPDSIDKVIVGEIPSQEVDPTLHSIVKANMVHGPCGINFNPRGDCMANGTF